MEHLNEQGYSSRDLQRVRMKAHVDMRISFSSFGEIPSFEEGDEANLSGDSNSNRDIATVAIDCMRS